MSFFSECYILCWSIIQLGVKTCDYGPSSKKSLREADQSVDVVMPERGNKHGRLEVPNRSREDASNSVRDGLVVTCESKRYYHAGTVV
jgi:hypothetical protein